MGRLLLLSLADVAAVVVALAGWHYLFAAYNRRRGAAALRWVQAACAGKGRILESHWLGTSRLFARLHFPSRSFENAHVSIKFRPRAQPIQWAASYWHKHKETLTFEADLGGTPGFHLDVVRHRWSARTRGLSSVKPAWGKRAMGKRDSREWEVYEPGPIILTTRTHWKKGDPVVELNALMSVRQQDVLEVCFRPDSPRFSATVSLDALADPRAAAGFLATLRELAAGASAHRQ